MQSIIVLKLGYHVTRSWFVLWYITSSSFKVHFLEMSAIFDSDGWNINFPSINQEIVWWIRLYKPILMLLKSNDVLIL